MILLDIFYINTESSLLKKVWKDSNEHCSILGPINNSQKHLDKKIINESIKPC